MKFEGARRSARARASVHGPQLAWAQAHEDVSEGRLSFGRPAVAVLSVTWGAAALAVVARAAAKNAGVDASVRVDASVLCITWGLVLASSAGIAAVSLRTKIKRWSSFGPQHAARIEPRARTTRRTMKSGALALVAGAIVALAPWRSYEILVALGSGFMAAAGQSLGSLAMIAWIERRSGLRVVLQQTGRFTARTRLVATTPRTASTTTTTP